MASSYIFKRKEVKYMMTMEQKVSFLNDIKDYIQADAFHKYTICNVYMDTQDDRLIRTSIDKPFYKEKMRIRSYGVVSDQDIVFIELKKKFDGIVYKRRVKIPHDEAMAYIKGEASRRGQIEYEIDYFLNHYEGISPAMFIAYDREAYSGIEDNELRVTFDDNIIWRTEDVSLTSEVYGNKLLDKDKCLLEIKCSNAMPLWLARALSKNKIYKNSFSKYGQAYMNKSINNLKSKI